MKLLCLVAFFAIICSLAFVSAADDAQRGLFINVQVNPDKKEGVVIDPTKIGPVLDEFQFQCAYGVAKRDDSAKSFSLALITTPLQLEKKYCNQDWLKVNLGTNGIVKKYQFDDNWDFSKCTIQGEEGPSINCDKTLSQCKGSVLCSSSFVAPTMVAFVLVIGLFALFF
jgi:hypothetical protein